MIDLESKKELLKAIEQCEMDRLNSLTPEELKTEYLEWFGIDDTDIKVGDEFIPDLMTDYMKYRQDEGIEELQELLVETLKRPKDKNCDTCNKSITDLEYANRGGNCDTCQPSLL
jgi:hypothetical protein